MNLYGLQERCNQHMYMIESFLREGSSFFCKGLSTVLDYTVMELEALAVDAISGVVSSASLFVSTVASTSVLRGLFFVLLSRVTGRLQTGHVRFPSVSHGSTHLQW